NDDGVVIRALVAQVRADRGARVTRQRAQLRPRSAGIRRLVHVRDGGAGVRVVRRERAVERARIGWCDGDRHAIDDSLHVAPPSTDFMTFGELQLYGSKQL